MLDSFVHALEAALQLQANYYLPPVARMGYIMAEIFRLKRDAATLRAAHQDGHENTDVALIDTNINLDKVQPVARLGG